MSTYYQCRLRRAESETIGWIEERGAKVGASVELKTADGERWDVVEVFTPGLDAAKLREKQQNDRNALPSIAADPNPRYHQPERPEYNLRCSSSRRAIHIRDPESWCVWMWLSLVERSLREREVVEFKSHRPDQSVSARVVKGSAL